MAVGKQFLCFLALRDHFVVPESLRQINANNASARFHSSLHLGIETLKLLFLGFPMTAICFPSPWPNGLAGMTIMTSTEEWQGMTSLFLPRSSNWSSPRSHGPWSVQLQYVDQTKILTECMYTKGCVGGGYVYLYPPSLDAFIYLSTYLLSHLSI